MLATFVALLCLTAMMPMKAQTGNSVSRITTIENITTSENIISTSTVYLGEVIVGGETKIKYIYSADVSRSEAVIANLTECLAICQLQRDECRCRRLWQRDAR